MTRTALPLLLALSLAGPALAAGDPAMPPFPTESGDAAAMLWLRANTSLGVGRHVVFGPDNVLVVTRDEAGADGTTHTVSFRQEATKIDYVGRTGGRSLRGDGVVDCAAGSFQAGVTELFAGSDLKGPLVMHVPPETAPQRPAAGTATAGLIREVCGAQNPAFASLAAPSDRRAPVASTPLPPPPSAPPAAASEPSAEAAPPPAPPPAAPRRTARAAARPAPKPTPPPQPPAPAAAPAAAGETVAQIGAFGSEDAARRAWEDLSRDFPDAVAGRNLRIAPGTNAKGAPIFRSLVGGFDSAADAQALCARLMASSRPCLVRKAP